MTVSITVHAKADDSPKFGILRAIGEPFARLQFGSDDVDLLTSEVGYLRELATAASLAAAELEAAQQNVEVA